MNANALKVDWNQNNKKEVEDAKAIYRKARIEHREIIDSKGKPITAFRPFLEGFVIREVQLRPHEFAARIFDETGDRRLIWNAADPEQIKDACKLFNKYIKKGWKAYGTDSLGNRGPRIFKFDYAKLEVVIDDKTTNEKLKAFGEKFEKGEKPERKTTKQKLLSFVEKFKEVKVLPKTYPG